MEANERFDQLFQLHPEEPLDDKDLLDRLEKYVLDGELTLFYDETGIQASYKSDGLNRSVPGQLTLRETLNNLMRRW